MPNSISTATITRTQTVGNTRAAVGVGKVFSYVKKDGTVKPERFIALGASDRLYSVKVGNGELSGTDLSKGKKPVAVLGTWEIIPTVFKDPSSISVQHRRHLQVGQLFRVKDNGKTYVHLGVLNAGKFLSFSISSNDYAVTEDGDKEVALVGTSSFKVNLLK